MGLLTRAAAVSSSRLLRLTAPTWTEAGVWMSPAMKPFYPFLIDTTEWRAWDSSPYRMSSLEICICWAHKSVDKKLSGLCHIPPFSFSFYFILVFQTTIATYFLTAQVLLLAYMISESWMDQASGSEFSTSSQDGIVHPWSQQMASAYVPEPNRKYQGTQADFWRKVVRFCWMKSKSLQVSKICSQPFLVRGCTLVIRLRNTFCISNWNFWRFLDCFRTFLTFD